MQPTAGGPEGGDEVEKGAPTAVQVAAVAGPRASGAGGAGASSGSGSARCLDYLGQNCNAGAAPDDAGAAKAEWFRQLDAAWAPLARRRAVALRRRALERAAVPGVRPIGEDPPAGNAPPRDPPSVEWRGGLWHMRRAASLGRSLAGRVAGCGAQSLKVRCACGPRDVPVSCGVRLLCPACKRKTYKRLRAKLVRALAARVEASERAWIRDGRPRGRRRAPTLLTLTTRHSGDVAADRETITRAWVRLRAWAHKRIGKFDYAMVWEVTQGEDGAGHVHAHVAALWPWIDFADVHDEWVRATDGRSSNIDIRTTRARTGAKSAQQAARYLSKYASKGVQLGDFAPILAAGVLDALWQRRIASTSRGFWLPREACCRACRSRWVIVQRPEAAPRAAPIWRAQRLWRYVGTRPDDVWERWVVPGCGVVWYESS